MEINKLSIVTPLDSWNPGPSSPDLFIRPSQEFSTIQQKGSSSDLGIKVGIENSIYRPVYMSELAKKLRLRDWNLGPRKIIRNDLLCYLYPTVHKTPDIFVEEDEGYVPVSSDSEKDLIDFINSIDRFGENGEDESLKEFYDILKNNSNDDMMRREIYFYDSSSENVNILDQVISEDIIKYDSDVYTDSLSIINLISPTKLYKAKVDLGIQYVKNLNSSGTKIYNYRTSFSAINKEEIKNDLLSGGWIEDINNDVQIEYISGVVKVSPISSEVTECIISNCTLTYGNIG